MSRYCSIPDISSIGARLDVLERKIGAQFDASDENATRRHQEILSALSASTSGILNCLDIEERLKSLERRYL